MLGTVIVGYDGSDSARDALALGEVLTEWVRADLIVARVYPWDPSHPFDELELAELEQAAHSVGGRAEIVASDAPAPGLQDLAAELGAGLLVVGSDGDDRARRTRAGRVGLHLLHGSPCPVAVAPRGFARRYAPDIRTIAVGYDCSEEANTVLRQVAELARVLQARVRIITASSEHGSSHRRPGDRLFDAVASLRPEIESSGVLRSGDPAAVLLDEAGRDADLLAVGSRRHGPVRRALLGSVSGQLIRQAACPVLVMPQAAYYLSGGTISTGREQSCATLVETLPRSAEARSDSPREPNTTSVG